MIEIIPFATCHTHGVVDVILPIQRAEFDIPITLEAQPDLLDIPGFYRQGHGNFWVAMDCGQVVGTVALLDIGERQAALRKMFVRASHRGPEYGTAKRLLETLLGWSASQQFREIFLGTTPRFLAAHRFYEKNGFREIAQSELPPRFPVMTVDTKFYVRTC